MSANEARLLFGEGTHAGPRDSNEDTVLSIELEDGRRLVAVADGMGGLENGELASRTALGTLYKALTEGAGLVESVHLANESVIRESDGEERGTTLVAALIAGTTAEVVNVGDSRAYLLDPLGLVQVTTDHTMRSEAQKEGAFTAAEVAASPWSEALARYLGAGKEVEVDYFGPIEVEKGGWLVLCSDGLHRVFSLDDLQSELGAQADVEVAAERLISLALERGTDDNVSVALAYRPGPTRSPVEPEKANGSTEPRPGPATPSLTGKVEERQNQRRRKVVIGVVTILLIVAFIAIIWWPV